LRRSRRSGGAL